MEPELRRAIAAQVVKAFDGHTEVAKVLGYTDRRNVWPWTSGGREFPDHVCPALERAANGDLTCEFIRPDLKWVRVKDKNWPHKAGRPLLDVSAPSITATEA